MNAPKSPKQVMPKIVVVDPFDYVVFGGTGDLSLRKLFPALYYRECDAQLPDYGKIIGVARRKQSRAAFVAEVKAACQKYVDKDFWDEKVWARFAKRLDYIAVDLATLEGYDDLGAKLSDDPEVRRVFYLALSPSLFGPVAQFLKRAELITDDSRVVLEKPIGTDLKSSQSINDEVGAVFREEQIYRIDHYLGKETVQNLLALRFGNILFEHVWSNAVIDHVQITVAETVGLGERAGYYDGSGAMRDMVQNHLLQLLCLTAMEAPYSVQGDVVRSEKLKVLRALRPIKGAHAFEKTVRGQYGAGAVDGNSVPGYADELGDASNTETFVAMKVEIDNWRWAGVPFYLRTGKRMSKRLSEIVITFRDIPHAAFGEASGQVLPNRLILNIQPDEGVRMEVMTKVPGPGGLRLRSVPLDLSFEEEFDLARYPDAYERLLLDVVRGNPTLFMRRDEVEAAWEWIDPILEAWDNDQSPPKLYQAGTWGPTAASNLIYSDSRSWIEDSQ